MRRACVLVAAALAVAVCVGCGGSVNQPATITGTYQWSITSTPACPVPAGFLSGEATFAISQTGSNWSASFTDSAGNSVSMSGTYVGGRLRGTFTATAPGGEMLTGSIDGFAVLHDNGMIELDGNLVVSIDELGDCAGHPITFWAMTQTGPPPQVLEQCPPLDLVFVMDTSGSMDDEAAALCAEISGVETDLRAGGLDALRVTLLGMTETATITETGELPPPDFACLTNTVYRIAGGDGDNHPVVPGDPPPPVTLTIDGEQRFFDPTVLNPFNAEAEELWAPAVAVAAAHFDWLPDPATGPPTVRLLVVLTDESPQSGHETCFPVDTAAVANTVAVANANRVTVSLILGFRDDEDPCLEIEARRLTDGTGGTFARSTDPGADLAGTVIGIVEAACSTTVVR